MSRTRRLFILVSVASVLGACAQSPTGPTEPSQPTATSRKPVPPLKANADDVCDWVNPWTVLSDTARRDGSSDQASSDRITPIPVSARGTGVA